MQQAGNGIGHISVGIILPALALQDYVLPCHRIAKELRQGLGIAGKKGRAEGAGKTRNYHIQAVLPCISLAQGLSAAFALRVACAQGIAVYVAAIGFIEKFHVPAVFTINLVG